MARIELELEDFFKKHNYTVVRNGWPDLLVKDNEGNTYFIEAKAGGDRIRKPQQQMLQMLSNLGFNVFVVSDSPKLNLESKFNWEKYTTQVSDLRKIMKKVEFELIKMALSDSDGNVELAAGALGLTVRQLRYKANSHKISRFRRQYFPQLMP